MLAMAGERDFSDNPKPLSHEYDHNLLSCSSSSFVRDVTYSCGSCGYDLNLNSSNRNTSVIGSKYEKIIKRGIISFFCIDETRFTQINKCRCLPFFTSKHSWGLFQWQTRLLCRNCGNHIGICFKDARAFKSLRLIKSNSSWDGISTRGTYDIKICALRPSFVGGL